MVNGGCLPLPGRSGSLFSFREYHGMRGGYFRWQASQNRSGCAASAQGVRFMGFFNTPFSEFPIFI